MGDHLKARVEGHHDKDFSDHVWISMDPSLSMRAIVSVNTFSVRNS